MPKETHGVKGSESAGVAREKMEAKKLKMREAIYLEPFWGVQSFHFPCMAQFFYGGFWPKMKEKICM